MDKSGIRKVNEYKQIKSQVRLAVINAMPVFSEPKTKRQEKRQLPFHISMVNKWCVLIFTRIHHYYFLAGKMNLVALIVFSRLQELVPSSPVICPLSQFLSTVLLDVSRGSPLFLCFLVPRCRHGQFLHVSYDQFRGRYQAMFIPSLPHASFVIIPISSLAIRIAQ